MRRVVAVIVGLGLFFGGASAKASPELVDQISAQLEQHAVVRAKLVQSRKMVALKRPVVSQGQLLYSRRDGVFLFIEQPLRVSYWLNERKVVEITADGQRREQDVKSNPALVQVGQVMRSLLGVRAEALKGAFEVTAKGSMSKWELLLTPRQAPLNQFIATVKVSGGRFIESMVLQEKSGDVIQTQLTESQALSDLPAADVHALMQTQ